MASPVEFTEYINDIPVHPVASLFPMIGDEELQALADDIKANGQREPIVLAHLNGIQDDEVVLIDGRNRFRACEIAGVEPEFRTDFLLHGEAIGPWIMSHNRHRRHMSKTQMATVAVEYEKWLAVEAKKRHAEAVAKANAERSSNPYPEKLPDMEKDRSGESSEQAGAMLGVSGRTVRDAKYVANNDPELFEKMRRNEITASAAAKRIRDAISPKPQPTPEEIAEKLVRNIAKHDEEVMELAWQILGEVLGK